MLKLNLAAARVNANVSQAEAAEYLGIAQSTLSNYETGQTDIPVVVLEKLCDLYKISKSRISLPTKSNRIDRKEQ